MLSISQLSMRFGAKILFKNVSLQFNGGNHYGLVGANGSGKSTLIRLLSSEMTPESGQISIPQLLRLGSLSQDHYLYQNWRILDVVMKGRERLWEALERKNILLQKEHFQESECEALMRLEKVIEEERGYAAEAEAAKLLEGLGIREEQHVKNLEVLSGGYKLRVLLAQVLFGRPDILVLDEPTNHLDLYSIKWLETYLRDFDGTLIVTSHDREFLNGICTHIADVDYGTIKIYPGNYEAFLSQKMLDREQKEHMLQKQDKKRGDLQGFVDRFGAKASKARQAQSKAKIIERLEEEMEAINLTPSSRIYPKLSFEPLRPSGATILTAKGVCKAFGPKKVLENVSFEMERGERVAILGPNGIGKSTLLEILMDKQLANQGTFAWGYAARCAYFPQDLRKEVKGDMSLLEWLGQFERDIPQERLRDLLGRVLFSGETVNQPIETLSGGETARLILAKMMLQKPNVMVFDEPTNHLDMEAIEELSRALETYEGTILFVSHNRYFVSRLANRIIEINYHGVKDFKGTYPEYLERQQNDFLSTDVALSQRYALENVSKQTSSSDYHDQKKLKNQKAQMKKKVLQAEEKCHEIEQKIRTIEDAMSADGFYQQASREAQQRLIDEKKRLEDALLQAMEEWELSSLTLQGGDEA